MTIQRRIFFSNILMIVLTLALGTIIFFAARFMIVGEDTDTRGGIGGRFPDSPHIPVIGASDTAALFEPGGFTPVANAALYRSDLGDFIIVLPDSNLEAIQDFMQTPAFILPTVIIYLVVVAFLGNILLAKYITRRIMTPINTLANGVQEITGGNLTHRIHYQKGDEFDPVCANFNAMAARLSDMVAQRQADENSRKELIAGISHDLRTPLTSVKAYLEGLRQGIATTPEMQTRYLDTIQQKTDDMEYIIKQLFTFSKIDIGEFPLRLDRVDIRDTLTHMVNTLAPEYMEMGLAVSFLAEAGGHVLIDVVQFKNILQNILGNSKKYCHRPDAQAHISCGLAPDHHIAITIQDNGPGVPQGMLDKMFDVFYRGDPSRNNPAKGSGLGLAISSKIIQRFGGKITAANASDGGLAITITLPLQKGVTPDETHTHRGR